MNKYFNSESACTIYTNLRPFVINVMTCVNDLDYSSASDAQSLLSKKLVELKDIENSSGEYLNGLFVLNGFIKFVSFYSELWELIVKRKFSESWNVLQNALDSLRCIKKFSNLNLPYFEEQLIELEKTYPYNLFISIGVLVESFECSICGQDIDSSDCSHRKGELYSGEMAIAIAKNMTQIDHVAMVSIPEDKRCVVIYENEGEQFQLIRYLSDLVKDGKLLISDFKGLSFIVIKKKNPDYIKQKRNDKCYCGSGIKFKKCCINSQYIDGDHVDIVSEPFSIEHMIT